MTDEEISFPANAIITILRKEAQLWRGKYEGKVSTFILTLETIDLQTGWFPPAYVAELPSGTDTKNGEK